jgi:aminopeptidase N
MSVDGLHSTRPIEFPVRAPREADAMFDVLTYEKGASVLRMLEQFLGPTVFRQGVRDYLNAHRFDNADTGDLWAALGRASSQPIPAVMDGWIFAPGYPLVSASVEGNELVLRQQRFNYLPQPLPWYGAAPAAAVPAPARWQVPVQLRVSAGGRDTVERVLLADAEARRPLPASADSVVVNEGGHGFYRVRYDDTLRAKLLARLGSLGAIERFNLVNDAWAVTVAGLMSLPDYLELTARFRDERDKNVWAVLIGSFSTLNRLITPADRPGLEALVRDRATPALAALGWTPRDGEDELARQLRGDLIRALGTLGNDRDAQARAVELYTAHTRGAAVDPNVLPALIAVLAHTGDAARYDVFLDRFPQGRHAPGGAALSLRADRLPAAGARRADAGPHGQRRDPHAGCPVRGAHDADAGARARGGLGVREEAVGHDGPPLSQARFAADGGRRHRSRHARAGSGRPPVLPGAQDRARRQDARAVPRAAAGGSRAAPARGRGPLARAGPRLSVSAAPAARARS